MAELRCSSLSGNLDEPILATASIVRSWLLIEQPGPWGSEALAQSRLPDPVATDVAAAAQSEQVRVLLLRRPDRPAALKRNCFLVSSGRRATWIEHRMLSNPRELLDVDLSALRGAKPGQFGDRWDGPLYLVCTNGRHDPCCAQLGRPVIRALLDRDGAWECSHVGGDRFAGNLVCMPHGLYFGRLGPEEALRVVDRYEEGELELEHFRGRAGDPFVVQAAEFFLRKAEGILGIDDVIPAGRRRISSTLLEVEFRGPRDSRYWVRVAVDTAATPRPLTCAAISQERPPEYSLVSLRAS